MTEPTPDETRQLEELRSRMRREYPGPTGAQVGAVVSRGIEDLRGAKIRNFVPVLVERSARRQLDVP